MSVKVCWCPILVLFAFDFTHSFQTNECVELLLFIIYYHVCIGIGVDRYLHSCVQATHRIEKKKIISDKQMSRASFESQSILAALKKSEVKMRRWTVRLCPHSIVYTFCAEKVVNFEFTCLCIGYRNLVRIVKCVHCSATTTTNAYVIADRFDHHFFRRKKTWSIYLRSFKL